MKVETYSTPEEIQIEQHQKENRLQSQLPQQQIIAELKMMFILWGDNLLFQLLFTVFSFVKLNLFCAFVNKTFRFRENPVQTRSSVWKKRKKVS